MIDDGVPICETTEPPTMSPTISIDRMLKETEAPTGNEEVNEEISSTVSKLALLYSQLETGFLFGMDEQTDPELNSEM